MSNHRTYQYKDGNEIKLGDIVYVLSGAYGTGITVSNTLLNDTFLKHNTVVSQSSYPDLSTLMGTVLSRDSTTSKNTGLTIIYALVYGNGLYVVGGASGVLATSTDAITWTARTSGTTSTILHGQLEHPVLLLL